MDEPIISDDGKWLWTGNEWIPNPQKEREIPPPPPSNQNTKFCSNCGAEVNISWNACANCGSPLSSSGASLIQEPNYQANTIQQSTDFTNLDTTLDEIQVISESRKKNSANGKRAIFIAIPSAIVVTVIGFLLNNYGSMKDYYADWSYFIDITFDLDSFFTWFYPYNDDFFGEYPNAVDWTPGVYVMFGGWCVSYLALYYYWGYRSQSLGKGGIFKANSLISSFEENARNYPNYPRIGEFNIVKSEFDSATKTAGIFGMFFGAILALIAILAIFGSRDNQRRY